MLDGGVSKLSFLAYTKSTLFHPRNLFTHLKQPLNDRNMNYERERVRRRTREGSSVFKNTHFNTHFNLLEHAACLKGQDANIMMSNTQKIPKVTADTICIKSQTTFTFTFGEVTCAAIRDYYPFRKYPKIRTSRRTSTRSELSDSAISHYDNESQTPHHSFNASHGSLRSLTL